MHEEFDRKPPSKKEIDAQIERMQRFFKESLSGYIGDRPRRTQAAWEQLRDQAKFWMDELSKCCTQITFKDDDGNDVTPEMIADWHFDTLEPKTININAVPKYPLDLIKVSLVLEDEDG